MSNHAHTRRRRIAAVAVAFLTFASLMLATAPGASAQVGEPVLTVTPQNDLVSDQQVQLTGTGFLPNTPIFFVMCPLAAMAASECDLGSGPSVQSDLTGSFTSSYNVTRVIFAPINGVSTLVDCAVEPCVIAAGDVGETASSNVPVTFTFTPLGTPEVTAEVSGDEFGNGTAHATGLIPGAEYKAVMCSPHDCIDLSTTRAADSAGEADLSFVTARTRSDILPGTAYDCLIDTCIVEVRQREMVVAETALTFPTPQLFVTTNDYGTLKAGTNRALMVASFTCDIGTHGSFRATVRQPVSPAGPAIVGTMTIENVQCELGRSNPVYITTRDFDLQNTDFVLGDATVAIEATPHRSFSQGTSVGVEDNVDLLDHDALAAALGALFSDPAQSNFRLASIAGVKARSAQDLIFAEEWRAAAQANNS